jgi:citrate lyase alpha subunit
MNKQLVAGCHGGRVRAVTAIEVNGDTALDVAVPGGVRVNHEGDQEKACSPGYSFHLYLHSDIVC